MEVHSNDDRDSGLVELQRYDMIRAAEAQPRVQNMIPISNIETALTV